MKRRRRHWGCPRRRRIGIGRTRGRGCIARWRVKKVGSPMTDEETIFAEALGKGSAMERGAYLDEACAGNAELRREVEALLLAHQRAGGILEAPPPGLDVTIENRPSSEG